MMRERRSGLSEKTYRGSRFHRCLAVLLLIAAAWLTAGSPVYYVTTTMLLMPAILFCSWAWSARPETHGARIQKRKPDPSR